MVHVPVLINVTSVPETVQTVVVADANATVSPELAVALTVIDPVESGTLGKLGNVIVWLALVTWKLCVTGVAAAQFALPACEARIVHLPDFNSVTVAPDTVQTVVVVDVYLTVSPELAVALKSEWSGAIRLIRKCAERDRLGALGHRKV